ncbi:MAG: CopD family protein [Candidatus Rokubacteria bacterium]|nr:CopD family protein [Candidatus Rokubacteria bacterium]
MASLALVGVVVLPLVARRSDRPTARAWDARMVRLARALALAAIVSGLGVFAVQAVTLEDRLDALTDPDALARVLLDTRGGVVTLFRTSLIAVLAAFLALRLDTRARADWLAARWEAVLLGVVATALGAAAGHAAAVEPDTAVAVLVDAVHLIAAGVWLGGLVPVALLLRATSHESGEDSRAFAVLAVRRFSRLAFTAVVVLVVTGLVNAVTHIGGGAALVGTDYGRLMLLKLLVIVPVLALGAVNRRRMLPALSGPAAAIGRPAMRRLAAFVAVETALGLIVVAIVAAMASTPPARHVDPAWPFAFRFTWDALIDLPGGRTRVLIGSQIVVLGIVAALAAFVARRRGLAVGGGIALVVLGASTALPPLAVDAYPTTYRRPAVPYTATSMAAGVALFREHCAGCHGTSGEGGGPAAPAGTKPPPDLRGSRTAYHTAGDLYWWITHGIAGSSMPAFGSRLNEEQRWDLVNTVRALGAAAAVRRLPPTVDPDGARLVAPDFSFAVGPSTPYSLREFRGRRAVLLILYTLPGSRERLGQLADAHRLLGVLGLELLAVPMDAGPDAIARLGATPRVLFPVVTSGAPEIVAAYRLFTDAPHTEFLIDRQGYLRARWAAAAGETRDPNLLLAEVQQLNEEPQSAPPADEHVH